MRTINIGKMIAVASARVCASVCLAGLLALSMAPARSEGRSGPTAIAVIGGNGNQVDVLGVEAHWDAFYSSSWLRDRGLDTRLTAQLAYWRSRENNTPYSSLADVSLTPLLRWSGRRDGVFHPYVEGGIGLHLLSTTHIGQRQLSTAAQFGQRIGGGFMFGPQHRYEAGIFVQHVSNGSVKKPNSGLTYIGLSLRMQL